MAQQITRQEAQEAIDPRHIALGRSLAVGTSICLIGSQQHVIPRVVTPADLGTLSVGQYHLVLLFGGNDDAQRARWMQAVHSPLWKAGLGGVVVETGGSSGVADLWVAHPLLPDRQVVLHQAAQEAEIITAVITSGQVARLPFPTNEHLPLLSQYMGAREHFVITRKVAIFTLS